VLRLGLPSKPEETESNEKFVDHVGRVWGWQRVAESYSQASSPANSQAPCSCFPADRIYAAGGKAISSRFDEFVGLTLLGLGGVADDERRRGLDDHAGGRRGG
jgi:hypothetical protein